MAIRIRPRHPALTGTAVAMAALLVPISAAAAAADAQTARRAAVCRFARAPDRAARLSRDLRAALPSTPSSAPEHEAHSDLWCAVEQSSRYGSVRVVRVLVAETVLRKAEELERRITRFRTLNLQPVNASSATSSTARPSPAEQQDPPPLHPVGAPAGAAQALDRLIGLLRRARRGCTEFGRNGLWGLTRTSTRVLPPDLHRRVPACRDE